MPEIKNRKEYDSIAALNQSGAKHLLKSPLHYMQSLNEKSEPSKALRMGSLIHAMILEGPEVVSERYTIMPEGIDRRTKEGKALYDGLLKANPNATLIPADEAEISRNVCKSVHEKLNAMQIAFHATEYMIQVQYCDTPLKCAIDAVGADGYLYDIKTTEDASSGSFLSSVRSYRYNLQAYFYMLCYEIETGIRPRGFRFIAAEKVAPFDCAVYELGPDLMAFAVADFNRAVSLYASCQNFGSWPGYPNEVQTLDIKSKQPTTFNLA